MLHSIVSSYGLQIYNIHFSLPWFDGLLDHQFSFVPKSPLNTPVYCVDDDFTIEKVTSNVDDPDYSDFTSTATILTVLGFIELTLLMTIMISFQWNICNYRNEQVP